MTGCEHPLWIFGYGSLIWRPGFPFVERRVGWVMGWTRRFWQASTDHRGTIVVPGRVVTLVPSEQARCWGVVYRVDPDAADQVLARLDTREQQGYRRLSIEVECTDQLPLQRVLVYVAGEENPHYVGPSRTAQIAAQICRSRGKSGPNTEYALKLADALRELGVSEADDAHVFEVAAIVRNGRQ